MPAPVRLKCDVCDTLVVEGASITRRHAYRDGAPCDELEHDEDGDRRRCLGTFRVVPSRVVARRAVEA